MSTHVYVRPGTEGDELQAAELYRDACRVLRSWGVPNPERDVKLLAAFAAGLPLRNASGSPPPVLTPVQKTRFLEFLSRRGVEREPVAYIVGSEEFMGLELKVTPDVLIPPPSAECLVERAGVPGRFLEVGTGNGAIAIALAVRGSCGVATDISIPALKIAKENARRHKVESRIQFVYADLFSPGAFDLVIANPPYVATAEMEALPPEVRRQPRLALDGGPDGLTLIRQIIAGARAYAPRFLLECAPHQMQAVRALAREAGYRQITVVKDRDGFDRVVDAT